MEEKLPKSLQRYAGRIADYSDARESGSGIHVAYRPGWRSCTDPMGIVHGDVSDTIHEAASLARSADRCDCAECVTEMA